jgi:hypothetical protein
MAVTNGASQWAWLALACCSLLGCGGDDDNGTPSRTSLPPVIGCEAIDPAACDIQTTACQSKLFELAACMRGSEAGELPPITHVSVADYTSSLEEDAAMTQPGPEIPHIEAALTLVGLAEPGALSADASVMLQATSVLASYRYESKDIVIIDRNDMDQVDASATLLHELTHALQDRESDLAAYAEAHFDAPSDAFLAADSVVEGEARFHEYVYTVSAMGYDPHSYHFDRLFQGVVSEDETGLVELPAPYVLAPYVFPYDWGSLFIYRAWSGHQSILDLFASPPPTTHEIMGSVVKVTKDTFTPTQFASPSPPDAWVASADDVLGAFGAFLMLEKLAAPDRARALALAWRGDRMSIYAGSEASGDPTTTAFSWSLDFDTEANATVVAGLVAALDGVEVQTDGTTVTLAAADNGSDVAWALGASLQ